MTIVSYRSRNNKVLNLLSHSAFLITTCSIGSTVVANEGGFVLEEVMVTARKREESLQDAPLSITALTGSELALRQIDSSQQLGQIAPNLSFESYAGSSGSNSAATVFIRGIGQTDFIPTTDPGVGIYVDGVYMARSIGGALDFMDLERVEVLRGPQGTLFGRNTIGGAVLLHSRKPSDEFEGKASVKVGSDERRDVTLGLDVPITATLSTQLNAATRRREGYVENVITGQKLGDDDSQSIRLAALWTPDDAFELFFSADHTRERESGAPNVLLAFDDTAAFPSIANALSADCPVTFPPGQASPPNDPACANAQWILGPHKVASNAELASELEVYGTSLKMVWDLEDITITSITAYRKFDSYSTRDGDNTPLTVFHTIDIFEQDQLSQELQFGGVSLNDRLKWILGLYYFEEEANNPNPVEISIGTLLSGGKVDNQTQAVFAQMTYNMTDHIELTLGIRRSDEEKDFLPDQYYLTPFITPGGAIPPLSAGGPRVLPYETVSAQVKETTPMANLAYHWSDGLMTYVSYSEGFKSGGFNQRIPTPLATVPTFEPEFASAWETGFKWNADNFRLNGAAFYTDYEDMQIVVRRGIAPITINGGDAIIKGLELEGSYIPSERWYFSFGLGYIDNRYTTLTDEAPTAGINKSSKIANSPRLSGNLAVNYRVDLHSLGALTARVDWSYKDDTYRTANNAPHLLAEAYDITNASLSWESVDEHWTVVLAGNNLTDEVYLLNGSDALGTGQGLADGAYSRGREWSLGVDYRF
jgi:iron complex outermembrane recepter protein